MDVGGGGGGDLPGTYTIDEGATRALGTNKRSASERFEAGAQTAKAARIESQQVRIGYPRSVSGGVDSGAYETDTSAFWGHQEVYFDASGRAYNPSELVGREYYQAGPVTRRVDQNGLEYKQMVRGQVDWGEYGEDHWDPGDVMNPLAIFRFGPRDYRDTPDRDPYRAAAINPPKQTDSTMCSIQ